MKNNLTTTLLSIVFFLISGSAIGQRNYWSNPEMVTNSLSNNRNTTIKTLNFIEEDIYIFWERSENDNSTSIVYRSFYNENDEHTFLAETGVNYTTPQLINVSGYNQYNDTAFYVFYQSDKTGTNKIYYRIYVLDEFSDQQQLTTSLAEQTNLQCSNVGRIVWMENDKLMHLQLNKSNNTFGTPIAIDSGNVSFPSVSQIEMDWMGGFDNNTVAYIKETNSNSNIMVSQYDAENGWLEPLVIFTGQECLNLSYCTGFGSSAILTWDYYNDTSWYIANYDMEDSQIFISQFGLQNYSQPRFYSGIIFVKNKYMDIGISSFIYQNNDTSSIYSVPFFYGLSGQLQDYENISGIGNEVTNPQILSGKVVGCNQYFINIWEEKINDNWQLVYSTSYECLSNINEEDKNNELNLLISPNPTHSETKVSFYLNQPSKITLSVKNLSGKTVVIIKNTKVNKGKHSYTWNTGMHKPGTYFLQLQSDYGIAIKKIIIIN